MAAEVSRHLDVKNAGLQQIAAGIALAAESQSVESIDGAINSLTRALPLDQTHDFSDWKSDLNKTAIQDAGFIDSPLKYLMAAESHKSGFNGLVPMDQLMEALRRQDLHFQNGVNSFLKCGIREALGGLKITPDPKIPDLPIPPPLNDLLSPDKLKNPDRALLHAAIRAANNMFSTLKNMQNANTDLQVNMMRFIRA